MIHFEFQPVAREVNMASDDNNMNLYPAGVTDRQVVSVTSLEADQDCFAAAGGDSHCWSDSSEDEIPIFHRHETEKKGVSTAL